MNNAIRKDPTVGPLSDQLLRSAPVEITMDAETATVAIVGTVSVADSDAEIVLRRAAELDCLMLAQQNTLLMLSAERYSGSRYGGELR